MSSNEAMTIVTACPILPDLAGNILRSLKVGDLEALESALDRAEEASSPNRPVPSDVAERLELIGAIASAMRTNIRRRRPGSVDAYLPLLSHLQRRTTGGVRELPPTRAAAV